MTTPTDEELEAMLERSTPYIDDAGFTQKVMTALPARRSRARSVALMVSGAAAAAVLIAQLAQTSTLISVAAAAVVLAVTAISTVLREAEA
jgi:hypothetical protein